MSIPGIVTMITILNLLLLSISVTFAVKEYLPFVLPKSFQGTWAGSPAYNVLGPLRTYFFSISESPDGDYLFENNLVYDSLMIGYQRFYIEGSGSTAGTLWYCGSLSNFSDSSAEQTGSVRLNGFKPIKFPTYKDLNVTFCLDSDNNDVMGTADLNPFMKGCITCDCANWTLSYDPTTETLHTQMSMSGAEGHTHSKHLWAELKKIGPAPKVDDAYMPGHGANFSCDFSDGGRDSVPVEREWNRSGYNNKKLLDPEADSPVVVSASSSATSRGCPFSRHKKPTGNQPSHLEKASSLAPLRNDNATLTRSYGKGFAHCYTLNQRSGFQLAWTIDTVAQTLRCSVSAPALVNADGSVNLNSTWVAIGFRPLSRSNEQRLIAEGTGHHMNFGMEGADIVAGSLAGGVRTMYAALYTGPPTPDVSLKIWDEKVSLVPSSAGPRVVLTFTRPLEGGYLQANYNSSASINTGSADIIWAVGLDSSTSDVGCNYHENNRGLRVIDWENPSIAMVDAWKC